MGTQSATNDSEKDIHGSKTVWGVATEIHPAAPPGNGKNSSLRPVDLPGAKQSDPVI